MIPQLTNDFLAVKLSHLAVASRRLAKVRGFAPIKSADCEDDGAEKTNQDMPEPPDGEVRVIQIRGILCRDCAGWFPWMTDTEEVECQIEEAESDANVKAILLDIDSPGGTVNGSVELSDCVASCIKPVVVYVAGDCDSAAYMLAAGADYITARKTASIGSIGTLRAGIDISGMFEQMGMSLDLFTSGQYKGAGWPGSSLTEPQRALFQERVNALAFQFQSHVLTYRPEVPFDAMQGQDFFGFEAAGLGLIDEVVVDICDAMKTAMALGS